MNYRSDIRTLETVPRLVAYAAVAGGEVDAGIVTVKAVPHRETVRVSWNGSRGRRRRQVLLLASFKPGLGGTVQNFRCTCGRIVRDLYLNQDQSAWACRCCLGLRYRSQRTKYPSNSIRAASAQPQ